MRYCGGLLRVLISADLDISLAVDAPGGLDTAADAITQPSQTDRHAAASQAAAPARAIAVVSEAAAEGQERAAAATGGARSAAAAATIDALHFPLQHYDRIKSKLQSNRKLGMALLEGYDQIPLQTLDVYR